MCIRKNSCLHKKIEGDILPLTVYSLLCLNTQQMLKTNIKKLSSRESSRLDHSHIPFGSLWILYSYCKPVCDLTVWTKVQSSFPLNVVQQKTKRSKHLDQYRVSYKSYVVFVGFLLFCFFAIEVHLRNFSEQQQPMPNQESNRIPGTPH